MLRIGDVKVQTPFALAPMAGVNCTSFRLLCRECGAGLIYTQMYHCNFLIAKNEDGGIKAVRDFINVQDAERPVAVQIVGADAEMMAESAKLLHGIADIVDINFGCPEDNMVKSGCGAHFAREPAGMDEIVRQVKSTARMPVTAKIRIGWDSQRINGVAVAEKLASLGIDAIAVHGRVAVQKYGGKANWEIIRHIKSRLRIPVIGNGDVNNAGRAIEMLEKTGCDIAMIGRRAMGDPGIFSRCNNKLNGTEDEIPSTAVLFKRFMEYYTEYDRDKSFSELRTHAMWFSKRGGMGPKTRKRISQARDNAEIISAMEMQ